MHVWSFALLAYLVLGMTVVLVTPARRELVGAFKDKDLASSPAWKRHVFRATVCTAVLVLWPIVIADWLREKKSLWDELREKARRKREGLRKRQDYDIVVDASEWDPRFNYLLTNWVEGEVRQLLPSDTVLKFEWQVGPLCGQGGYAIERSGRIVAEHLTWIS
jgi:hypothetical protein